MNTAPALNLFLTGYAREAVEHLLTAPAASRLQEVGTFETVAMQGDGRPALQIKIPDAEINRLSRGERVLVQVVTALGRPAHAVRIGEVLSDLDDRTFDTVMGALALARGRDLTLFRLAS